MKINFQKPIVLHVVSCYYIYNNNEMLLKYKTETEQLQMNIATTDLTKTSYLTYKRMYDFENGTNYASSYNENTKYQFTNVNGTLNKNENEQFKRVEIDGKRNIIGDYNNNNVMIEKTFTHFNAMKRAMTLSQNATNDEMKMFHENEMYRELMNVELSLRTMKQNIKRQNNE